MAVGRRRGTGLRAACLVLSAVAALHLVALLAFLLLGSLPALKENGLSFLTSPRWSYRREAFGAAAMLYGTAVVSAIALLAAAPLGLLTAVYTSEMASPRVRRTVKVLVELLAGVPSVVFGLLGILVLRPALQGTFARLGLEEASADSLLAAGLLLALMLLPTLATLADDALQAVPAAAREAARGLGLTRAETVTRVVVPQALPGLLGAFLLALGRALGETTAVFLVVGRADGRLPESLASLAALLSPGQTLTTKLGGPEVNLSMGDPHHRGALLALAFVLLVGVLAATLAGLFLRRALVREEAA